MDPNLAIWIQAIVVGMASGGFSAYVATKTLAVRVDAVERVADRAHSRIDDLLTQPKGK